VRILSLRLANYRGITKSEVRFAPCGLTVVEGPNETGKTSLIEAIDILFKYPDSSSHRNVEEIKPVHRDAGAEIELQAESGPYAFTYFKRFHKKSETMLRVTKPKPENLTGREAHQRAKAILDKTIDVDLWQALCIQQGEDIRQANLSGQTSLSAALDKAAGGHSADPRGESLFEIARAEYSRYYIERGGEKKELQEARKAEEDTKVAADSLRQQLQDIDKDIDHAAHLQAELGRLQEREQKLEKAVVEHETTLVEIRDLESTMETACLKLESVRKSEEAAKREKEIRQGLIDKVTKARNGHTEIEESSTALIPALQGAEEALRKAALVADKAEKQHKKTEALRGLHRADVDYFKDKLDLEQLAERKERTDRSRKDAALAEALLAKNQVDKKRLRKIQDAERALDVARAQLNAGAPSLKLRALVDLTFKVDGKKDSLRKSKVRTMPVPDRVRITFPGTAEVEVAAGASATDLAKGVEKARQTLKGACEAAGVTGPDEAKKTHEERREAQRKIESREQVERDNLRDLTYEQLAEKVIGLGENVPAYPASRVRKPPLAPDLDSAKKELQEAETLLAKANREWDAAREEHEAARKIHDGFKGKHQKALVELDLKAADLKRNEGALAGNRARASDDELKVELKKATGEVRSWEEKVRVAENSLGKKGPERVRLLAETAKGSLQTTRRERAKSQDEFTAVRTRLKILGEDGLYEKVQAAEGLLNHARRESKAACRRADAARLLFETMREEHDRARRAYVVPLRERIEQLGRILFNDTFQVEVGDDLTITSMTRDGITVPFRSLSGGTREQLSLVARLACTMIVGKDDGAPLILDDALGYTDPERLTLMGAVIAKAGQEWQIIILTCVPDRYSNVGEATVIWLG